MIITGSGQGLGKGFAARLLNAGAKVCNLIMFLIIITLIRCACLT